ncbi:MAG: hypothetical protein HF314_14825 [Ignavibacteria bacterium]|jgi:hypothetical protein|nr:hypothetical protein [Ignavibacteria bacterium]MCU7504353.1 hypothetical protein [Ignavibacteria bacterium]MCU7517576.1 hypothetical protein [Ignavibacteria bacterium]
MKKILSAVCLFIALLYTQGLAQEERIEWKRTVSTEVPELHLFHSTESLSLPTADMLQKGDVQFEISHRFYPLVKTGIKTLFGIDGPVNMRLALGYALTNSMTLTLGRSNLNGNVDLRLKYKILQIPNGFLPAVAALRLGTAWNTEVGNRKSSDNRNFQYYAQLIINTLYGKTIGLGIVPSFLYNSSIFSREREHSVTLGTYAEVYLTHALGLIFEWNPTVSGYRLNANPMAFAFEINTGGHFFKILLTNSTFLNPSQYLAGAEDPVKNNNWRLGFNITRLLKF